MILFFVFKGKENINFKKNPLFYRIFFSKIVREALLWLYFLFLGLGYANAQIFSWKNPNNIQDSLGKDSLISSKISKDFFRKDTIDFVRKPTQRVIEEGALVKNDRKKILGDLQTNGSIIRGITFGNNQGSSVQSTMDMQIKGNLSKDVSILASIYDHNLPVQADGYTQTLEEFDRIFIQLNIKNKNFLTAGHIDLAEDNSYFGKYQRRSLGLQYQTSFGQENKTFANVSLGVARSEFHRVRFQGVEGNQGPYRMNGKNGETFITIISGSEQVFIDGILMKRGEDADYIINYNTGEVTFTTNRPIYRQNFITISYNYTNRNYSRFLVTGSVAHHREKFRVGLGWFVETDNKNAPLSLTLGKEDITALANAGNDTNLMYAPSAKEVEYDANKTLYRKVTNGQGDYYEFSTDKNETLYEVAFSYIGQGRGDYRLVQTINNGRVFSYVGAGLGDYSAVRKLPSPKTSQVFSMHTEYDLEAGKVGADFSLSYYDANLFSKKGNEENIGYAGRIFGQKTFRKGSWEGTPILEYQRIDRNFHILDRLNSVEFSRDFNLAQEFNHRTQNRLIFGFKNTWKTKNFLNYRLNFLNETAYYKGFRNELEFLWQGKNLRTNGEFSVLNTKGIDQNTDFIRGNFLAERVGRKGSWGMGASMEHNLKKIHQLNKYDATSFSWKEIFLQKKIGDSLNTKLLAKVYFRDNDSIREDRLQNFNHILGIMAEAKIFNNEKTKLTALAHYRKFFYQNQSLPQDFLVGNITYSQKVLNGLRVQALYELGNGQEAQRAFQYIKVTDGQGIYKWTDYNADGVQQLDEFEVAEYTDLAQYIRVYTDAMRYLPSNKNKLEFSFFLNPHQIFNTENSFVKRWNANFSYSVHNAFYKKDKVLVVNPFQRGDILRNQNVLVSLLFNPNEKSGLNANYRYTQHQNLINANFSMEHSEKNAHFANFGYQFNKNFRADWENRYAENQHHSQLFSTRNYLLNILETRPKATYKFTENTQAEISMAYIRKNRKDGIERLQTIDATGGLHWENKSTSVRGNFSYVHNNFEGNSFSVVGNQMLDGLKAGKNMVWNISFQQMLNSFISLNIHYEGRNATNRTIHIGSMQVKASF